MLTDLQKQYEAEIVEAYAGSCMPYLDPEEYGMDEDDINAILIENDVEQCVCCGWWQYPGDYCTEHDHDEIVCHDCCAEQRNEL